MSRNVTVVVATAPQPAENFPNQTFAGIVIKFGDLPGQVVTAPTFAATFTNVPAGKYPMSGQAIDTAGAIMGAQVTGDADVVDIPAPMSPVEIPSAISFTLS